MTLTAEKLERRLNDLAEEASRSGGRFGKKSGLEGLNNYSSNWQQTTTQTTTTRPVRPKSRWPLGVNGCATLFGGIPAKTVCCAVFP